MKTEKEKAQQVLKERERAKKGFAVTDDEGHDPLDEQPGDREEKVEDVGLALDLGLKR